MELNPFKLSEYKIVSAIDQQMVLDCVMDQNNFLVIWKWHQGNNQRWNIIDLGNGKFTFFNVMSSQAIMAPVDIHKDGWFVKCARSKKSSHQIWQMVPVLDEKFKQKNAFIIRNSQTGKALDLFEGKAKNGQSIINWQIKKDQKINSKLNQIWLIEPVNFISDKKSFYKIFSAADYGLVFDASKSQADLNSLILYPCHKGDNQKFHIETVKGKYLLTNKDQNLCITVDTKQKGSKVKVSLSKKEDNQLWQLIACKLKQFQGKSAYYIKSVYGLYLGAINGQSVSGSNIVQSQYSDNHGLIWLIHKI